MEQEEDVRSDGMEHEEDTRIDGKEQEGDVRIDGEEKEDNVRINGKKIQRVCVSDQGQSISSYFYFSAKTTEEQAFAVYFLGVYFCF